MARNTKNSPSPSLPEQTLKRIDDAFDRAVAERFQANQDQNRQRPQKRRRIAQEVQPAGGFLLDDADADIDMGGGFIPESTTNEEEEENDDDNERATHIPLSLIPSALQHLDFDPSDADVLDVFASAASSWSGNIPSLPMSYDVDGDDDDEEGGERREGQEQFVSRTDWHAVCAALIPAFSASVSVSPSVNDGEESPLSAPDSNPNSNPNSDSDSDRLGSADLNESDSSSDEYIPEPKSKSSKTKTKTKISGRASTSTSPAKSKLKPKSTRKKKDLSSSSSSSSTASPSTASPKRTRPLTSRQQQDTLSTYALFFPSSSPSFGSSSKSTQSKSSLTPDELSHRRLTIKDVASAAASIKEKITAEEIIEMLSFFSTSSQQKNPSLSFQEFQQMMVSSKLA